MNDNLRMQLRILAAGDRLYLRNETQMLCLDMTGRH